MISAPSGKIIRRCGTARRGSHLRLNEAAGELERLRSSLRVCGGILRV